MRIPFNKPYFSGKETEYIRQAVDAGKISGNGQFTKRCHRFFEKTYGFTKCLLTTSCSDALEMAAILLDIQPGDEVIIPSFTFVSTANAFVLRGAKIIFADSSKDHPNIDVTKLEQLITPKTKAIVVVHYAGVSCDMNKVMSLADEHGLYVVEDAAHAIDSYFKDKPLGGIGHFGTFSFHESKNIISGEGGMLAINDERFLKRAEIIWEKGTDRAAFFRGDIDKYDWVDVGSSFLPSDVTAAFLYAQLESLKIIQDRRLMLWQNYARQFESVASQLQASLPNIPDFATNNAHMFYLMCDTAVLRNKVIQALSQENILAVFHYQPLHKSPFYKNKHVGGQLPNAEEFADHIVRLPMFYDLKPEQQDSIVKTVSAVLKK